MMDFYKKENGLWYIRNKNIPSGKYIVEWIEDDYLRIFSLTNYNDILYAGPIYELRKENREAYTTKEEFLNANHEFFIDAAFVDLQKLKEYTDAELLKKTDKTTKVNNYTLDKDINLTKTDIGLGEVDNTSDLNKPLSNSTINELAKKVDKTITINGYALDKNISLVKSDVGLGNVDNTTDKEKPISDKTQTALDNISDHISEEVKKLTDNKVDKTTKINGYTLDKDITLIKSDVGLSNVDNTSDIDKPISTATNTRITNEINTLKDNVSIDGNTLNKLRLLIKGLQDFSLSNDASLDTIQEIVDYIKLNKSLIDGLTTNKVNYSDIVNELTSVFTNKPLSALQGKLLKELIDSLQTNVDTRQLKPAEANELDIAVFDNAKSTKTSSKKFNDLGVTTNDVWTADKIIKHVSSKLVGILDWRGSCDISSGLFPSIGGSGTDGAVMKGNVWLVSVGGTIQGNKLDPNTILVANIDLPGQVYSNWTVRIPDLNYTAENTANKETGALTDSDVKYPSSKLVKDSIKTVSDNVANNYVLKTDNISADKITTNDQRNFITSTDLTSLRNKADISYVNLIAGQKINLVNGIASNIPILSSDGRQLSDSKKAFNDNGLTSSDIWSAEKIKSYILDQVTGVWDWIGDFDASLGVFPTTGGSADDGSIMKSDLLICVKEGVVSGRTIKVNDIVVARIDKPGQDIANWFIQGSALSYQAENIVNKETDILSNSTVKYPSSKLVKDSLDLKLNTTDFNFPNLGQKPTTIEGYGITNGVKTDDARLTNARPASDVYSWAKQPNKPTYNFGEIGAKPTSLDGYGNTFINKDVIVFNQINNTSDCLRFLNKTWQACIRSNVGNLEFFYGNQGADGILAGEVRSDGLYSLGKRVWDAGNFNPSNYLPLSGGSLTGGLSVGGNILFLDKANEMRADGRPYYGLVSDKAPDTSSRVHLNGYYGVRLSTGIGDNILDISYNGGLNFNGKEVYHGGNSNKSDVDWNCKTLNCTSISALGNLYCGTNGLGAGNGLSLYGSTDPNTYGIHFSQTGNFGKHGDVQGDWATYYCVAGGVGRGHIFRTDGANVASIANTGVATFDQLTVKGVNTPSALPIYVENTRDGKPMIGFNWNTGGIFGIGTKDASTPTNIRMSGVNNGLWANTPIELYLGDTRKVWHTDNFVSGRDAYYNCEGNTKRVVGELMWKNYGNNHTIFDASNSTAPNGTAISNSNPTNGWAPTYPTLMGWNGSSTYGVKVDVANKLWTSNGWYVVADGNDLVFMHNDVVKFRFTDSGVTAPAFYKQ